MKRLMISYSRIHYIGLIWGIVGYALMYTVGVLVLGKTMIYYLLQTIMAFIIVYCLYKEIQKKRFYQIDSGIYVLIVFFIIWQVIQLLRGALSDLSMTGISHLVLYPRDALFYLTPLFCFVPISLNRLHILSRCWVIYIVISICLSIYFRDVLMVSNLTDIYGFVEDEKVSFYNYLALSGLVLGAVMGVSFLIINDQWNTPWYKWFVYISFGIGLYFAASLGRRGGIASAFLILLLSFILKIRKRPVWIFISILLFMGVIYAINNYLDEILNLFPILSGRLTDDTRTWAENELYSDMRDDTGAWIFGKGSRGTYYSPAYGTRSLIETGFLDIILHSGLIGLILYVSILFISFWKGFFKSNNRIVNAMALYLLAQIIFLYPGTPIGLSLGSYSVWLCIAVCSSKKLRESLYFSHK